jgi:hypothetical protein
MGHPATGSHAGLAGRARRQHGLFTLEQVLELGFTRPYVRRRLDEGAWQEVDGKVYRSRPTAPMTWQQQLMARVLTTGGIASGRSAAALYGLLPPPKTAEVLVARSARSARHRSAGVQSIENLDPRDVTTVAGVRATAPGTHAHRARQQHRCLSAGRRRRHRHRPTGRHASPTGRAGNEPLGTSTARVRGGVAPPLLATP